MGKLKNMLSSKIGEFSEGAYSGEALVQLT